MVESDKGQKPATNQQPVESDFVRTLVHELMRENRIERRWGLILRLVRTAAFVLIAVAVFLVSNRPDLLPWGNNEKLDEHTAMVIIKGELSADSGASADRIIPAIKAAFDNEKSKAVILRINSPGGSAVQAGLLYDEIMAQRTLHPKKPIYAVIEDMGASGGYYVAAAANKIYANRASLVGSIGVISSGFGFTGLMEKLGIERRAITAGANKDLLDPFAPLTDEVKSFWEGVLAQTHEQFISRVKASRGDALQGDSDKLFSGLIWNGEQAKKLGLIDGLMSTEAVARDVVGAPQIINYTPKQDFFAKLANKASLEAMNAFLNEAAPKLQF